MIEPGVAICSMRAIALDPGNAFGYLRLAETLNLARRPAEAIGLAKKAMRLDPLHRNFYEVEIGFADSLLGQHEAAISILKRVLAHYPNNLGAHGFLVFSYSELGREEEAQAEVAEMLRISPNFSLAVMKQTCPLKDPAAIERLLAALRKAGLK
jgi:adenylate cyclase